MRKTKKKKTKKSLEYYQVSSKDKKINFGVFPATRDGYLKAKEWAVLMKKETGMDCCVKKH